MMSQQIELIYIDVMHFKIAALHHAAVMYCRCII